MTGKDFLVAKPVFAIHLGSRYTIRMRNGFRLAAPFVLLAACTSSASPAPMGNALAFSTETAGNLETLRIGLTIDGDADGETVFRFPDAWGPQQALGNLVSDRAAFDAATGAALRATGTGAIFTVAHLPGQAITLSYTVRQDYEGLPQWGVQRLPGMRPVLQRDHASLIGHTFLPSVDGRDPDVRIQFDDIPGNAAFSQPSPEGISAPVALSMAQDSIYALGAFSVAEAEDTGMRVAMLGEWDLSELDIAARTDFVIDRASREFRDAPFDRYFVAVAPLPDLPEGSSVIGTSFTQSFFILATRNADAENLTHTIVHEVLHEWITRRMGVTDEATDPSRMWFIEGFTEYYTQRILLDAGLIDLPGFLGSFNDLWAEYDASTVNTTPAGELVGHVFDSRETERLPYQRGAFLALSWDTTARANGTSLADALAALIDRADAIRARGETPELTDAAIETALRDAIGPRFTADLDRFIKGGAKLSLPDLALPACLTVSASPEGAARLALAGGANPEACTADLLGQPSPPAP